MPPLQRIFWLVVLAFHAMAAAGWLWFSPGGFPLWHSHFWSNRVVPVIVLALVTVAFIAARRGNLGFFHAMMAAFPACWFAAAVVGRIVFPFTLAWLFVVPLAGSLVMAAALAFRLRVLGRGTLGLALVVALLGAGFGASLPLSQRPPEADTRPLNPSGLDVFSSTGVTDRSFVGRLSARVSVLSGDGSLSVKAGRLTLSVQPVLRFLSRSPDGCWTILLPASAQEGPELRLKSSRRDTKGMFLQYRADYEATLQVDPDSGSGPIRLESFARLSRPIDSHLNAFCDIDVSGHQRLFLEFSPCPGSLVEVRAADYPIGRPLRAACVDASGEFRIVEASTGEKGPFNVLAKGRLRRGEPLGITLHNEDVAVAKVVLEDWSAQAGTALSPTAGWGFPVNAIEFSLAGDAPNSPAVIYTTLAGTSVGRGGDSVGHGAGVYRNRMTIEILDGSRSPK